IGQPDLEDRILEVGPAGECVLFAISGLLRKRERVRLERCTVGEPDGLVEAEMLYRKDHVALAGEPFGGEGRAPPGPGAAVIVEQNRPTSGVRWGERRLEHRVGSG